MTKVNNPEQYIDQKPPDIAKQLGIDIDDFLDSIFEQNYYYCSICGKIRDIEELGNNLESPCNKCGD